DRGRGVRGHPGWIRAIRPGRGVPRAGQADAAARRHRRRPAGGAGRRAGARPLPRNDLRAGRGSGRPAGGGPAHPDGAGAGRRLAGAPGRPRCGQRRLAARRGPGPQGGPGQRRRGGALPGQTGRLGARGGAVARTARRRRVPVRRRAGRLGRCLRDQSGPPRAARPGHRPDRRVTAAASRCENKRMPSLEEIRAAPKVLLHDHLDGGLRAATVVDLARSIGYDRLPSDDVDEVALWLQRGASRGHLNLYLDAFQHTLAVMQTREALIRVAAECAEDLAADGVVYAEVRFAPELHVVGGLSLNEVVEAVLEGFRLGSEGRGITIYALLTAMRTAARSLEIAELAVRYRDRGVAGFDIAGAEAGWPPSRHLDAFQYVARENFHITIHAGEGFGLPSIWEALQWCGAERLGHGVRIVDDIRVTPEGAVELGRLAAYIRDRRIPLEMCPTSNVQTGAAASIAEHPIGLLRQLSFRVTVNIDNRLMSQVTLSSEFHRLVTEFGYGWTDIEWLTVNAMKSAFAGFDERLRLINTVIKPGFATARAISDAVVPVGLLGGQPSD